MTINGNAAELQSAANQRNAGKAFGDLHSITVFSSLLFCDTNSFSARRNAFLVPLGLCALALMLQPQRAPRTQRFFEKSLRALRGEKQKGGSTC